MEAVITKEQAIALWFKFIDSNKVRKDKKGYGPGGYGQFILNFELYGKKLSEVTLITNNVYEQEEFNHPISENCIKALYTPYGQFNLTCEEATECRSAWVNRDQNKGKLPYEELIKVLN